MSSLVHKLNTCVGFGEGLLAAVSLLRDRWAPVSVPSPFAPAAAAPAVPLPPRPECFTDPRLAPVRRHFANNFPELLPEKDKANEVILVKAHGIFADLEEGVRVVVDWVDFQTEVLTLLAEATQVIPFLSLEHNPEITMPVLDLIALSFRLCHCMATVPDVPVAVGLWGVASGVVNQTGVPEHVYGRLADYVCKLTAPSDAVQKWLEPFSVQVWGALVTVHAVKLECERYLDGEVPSPLLLLNRPRAAQASTAVDTRLLDPELADVLERLCLYPRVCAWLGVCTLACPWLMHLPAHWDLLQHRLVDGYLLHVHGELVLHLQKDWVEFVKRWDPADKGVKAAVKALKPKDKLKLLEQEGVAAFPTRHRLRRVLILQAIERMQALLDESPGLVAPKLLALLAAVACGAGEIDAYMLHHKCGPRKAMKEYVETAYNDDSVLDLIGSVALLVRTLHSHTGGMTCDPANPVAGTGIVARYYHKYVTRAHASALAVTVDAVRNGEFLPPDSVEVLDAMVGLLDSTTPDFALFRSHKDSILGTVWASVVASELKPRGPETVGNRVVYRVTLQDCVCGVGITADDVTSVSIRVAITNGTGTELASASTGKSGPDWRHVRWDSDAPRSVVELGVSAATVTEGACVCLAVVAHPSGKVLAQAVSAVGPGASAPDGVRVCVRTCTPDTGDVGTVTFAIASDFRAGSGSDSSAAVVGKVTILSAAEAGDSRTAAGAATSGRSGIRAVPQRPLPTLARRLRLIARHTQFVDSLSTLLHELGSFKYMWVRRSEVEAALASRVQSRGALSPCLHLLPLALLALARAPTFSYAPASYSSSAGVSVGDRDGMGAGVGAVAVETVQNWLAVVIGAVTARVLEAVDLMAQLDAATRIASSAGGDLVSPVALPAGAVNPLSDLAAIAPVAVALNQCRARLRAYVSGLGRLGCFTVHDTVLDASAHLRQKLADLIRNVLREAAPPVGPLPLPLPSVSLDKLRRTIAVCTFAAGQCMDISTTVLEVWAEESTRAFAAVGDSLVSAPLPLSRPDLVAMPEGVARRAALVLERTVASDLNCSRPPLVYVPARHGYYSCNFGAVTRVGAAVIGEVPSPLENNQLRCLAKLLGPCGVRTCVCTLLGLVRTHLDMLRTLLIKHARVLVHLPQECTNTDSYKAAVREMGSDVGNVFGLLMRIGDALVLSRLLLHASSEEVCTDAPLLNTVAALSRDVTTEALSSLTASVCLSGEPIAAVQINPGSAPAHSYEDPSAALCAFMQRLQPLTTVSVGCMPFTNPTSPSPCDVDDGLTEVFAEFCQSKADAETWLLLPAAAALATVCGNWDGTLHVSDIGVFTNNAMVIPTAVYCLLAAAHRATSALVPKGLRDSIACLGMSPERVPGHLLWQHVYLKVAGVCAVHLTAEADKRLSIFKDKAHEQQCVALVLEEYLCVSGLARGDLEKWLPAAKLHSAALHSQHVRLRNVPKSKLLHAVTYQHEGAVSAGAGAGAGFGGGGGGGFGAGAASAAAGSAAAVGGAGGAARAPGHVRYDSEAPFGPPSLVPVGTVGTA